MKNDHIQYVYVNASAWKLFAKSRILYAMKQKLLFSNLYISIHSQTSYISGTLGNKIVDHSDVVGASSVSAAPATSSFST